MQMKKLNLNLELEPADYDQDNFIKINDTFKNLNGKFPSLIEFMSTR